MESYEMSKTYQYRKVMKPLLERKRRARINKCLDELKDLMVDCMKDQGDNFAKLEKADILELTVDHLRKLRHTRHSQPLQESFRSGFVHAANEVSRALAGVPGVNIQLGTKLMTHLGKRLNQIEESEKQPLSQTKPVVAPLTVVCGSSTYCTSAQLSPASSGYGSDSDCCSPVGGQQGLLQIAPVPQKDAVWRPW